MMWSILAIFLSTANATSLPPGLPLWLREINRLVPPPPVVDTCSHWNRSNVFHWAFYHAKESSPYKVVHQKQRVVQVYLNKDSLPQQVFMSGVCFCDTCHGAIEPVCSSSSSFVWIKQVKTWSILPFEFSRFPEQPDSRPNAFLSNEGLSSYTFGKVLSYRVERDSVGRVRKTVSGTDADPSTDIDLYLPQQDSLGRDTVVTWRQTTMDSTGKQKRSNDWQREYRSYDSRGRLERYWLETDLSDPREDLSGESCLETQFLYDARGFNHIQLHRIPRDGEVVAVSSFENNREGRPIRQRVGYIQNGKVVDWLVGNFWRYDSLGRLTYRVQYTNPQWIRNLKVKEFYLYSNCNWWNRP